MSDIAKVNLTAYEAPSANALKTCTPEFCGRFNYHDIPEYYGGLFKTTSESHAEHELWSSKHRKEFGQTTWVTVWFMLLHGFETKKTSYNHDYDQCCPTAYYCTRNTFMTNINGEIKQIVHLDLLNPPKYQWVRKGWCHPAPHVCRGTCRMEHIVIHLLVFNFSTFPPFSFDAFSVPGYCSCKRIGK